MLISIEEIQENIHVKAFIKALQSQKLLYYAHDLLDYLNYDKIEDIDAAIDRAINICHSLNMPVNENFMMIYMAREDGQLRRDWRLSPLAYYLVIINGDPVNTNVARAQVGILMKILEEQNM